MMARIFIFNIMVWKERALVLGMHKKPRLDPHCSIAVAMLSSYQFAYAFKIWLCIKNALADIMHTEWISTSK